MEKLEKLLFILEMRYNMYKDLCHADYDHEPDDIFEQIGQEISKMKHNENLFKQTNKPRRTVKRFKGTEHPYGG